MNVSSQLMIYVCELARTGSFHKTAITCNTSQPNISMQIKKLEKQLQIDLFDRSQKKVLPTPKGREVITLFNSILKQLDSLQYLHDKQIPESLKLGIFPSIAPYFLPTIITTIKETFPTCTLHITEDKTERIITKLSSGELDIVIAASPIQEESLVEIPLFEEPFVLAVSKNHTFSKEKHISLQQIKKETILLLQEGHCLRDHIMEICKQNKLAMYHQFESASLETLRMLIKLDIGVSFIPEICKNTQHDMVYIPFKEPKPKRKISFYTKKNYPFKSFLNNMNKKLGHNKKI
ncbi:MAG: hypothetical protein CMP21_05625 [Rickettsiales bacterium]|nr:hypothetical protein [Rickettsiales bacterium]|tara:strand:- start:3058 stop:3933 length:876 start_codon:yes stop_codon:yes gene_type:complete